MFDIPFHIDLFISLIELEDPLNTSNKRTDISSSHTYRFIISGIHY